MMLLALLVVVGAETPTYTEGWIASDCGETIYVVPKAQFELLVETNVRMYKELVARAKPPPKCADVTVTEPPKREIPPLVKEKDL